MRDPYEFQEFWLPNGIRLLAQERESPVQASALCMRAGSRYDYQDTLGLAHCFEHVACGQTADFGNWEAMTDWAEDHSLVVNYGTTSTEMMCWRVTSLPAMFSQGLYLLNQIVFQATLAQSCLEHEQDVIVREIKEEMSPELRRAGHEIAHRLWSEDWPLRERIEVKGTPETVASITRQDLVRFREQHIVTDNMTFVTAGPLSASEVHASLNRMFFSLARGTRQQIPAPWRLEELPTVKPGFVHVDHQEVFGDNKDREEVYANHGVLPCGEYDFASLLLTRVMARALLIELRTNRRLTYGVTRHHYTYPEVSRWQLMTTCPVGRTREVAQACYQLFRKPTPELRQYFKRMKQGALDEIAMREYTTRRVVKGSLGELADFNRVELDRATRERYERVTFDDIVALLPFVQPDHTVRAYGCYGQVREPF